MLELELEKFVVDYFNNCRLRFRTKYGIIHHGIANLVPFIARPRLIPKTPGIYIIRNRVTTHFYVGSTGCLYARKTLHVTHALSSHYNPNLKKLIEENGVDGLDFQYFFLLETENNGELREKLYQLEQELLDMFFGNTLCLNVSRDVKKPWLGVSRVGLGKGRVRSEETIKKMAEACRKMAIARKGIPRPLETLRGIIRHRRATERPLYIEGRAYPNSTIAGKALGIGHCLVYWRANSKVERWKDWNFVDQLWILE
jgi:hypothetical protein